MKKLNSIGIIGGMGPSASVYMHSLLVELSAKKFGAFEGDEFPEIIHNSIPISDFVSDENKKRKALAILSDRVQKLSSLDMISSFGIACNTAHLLLPSLQKVTKIPFVSMIEGVADAIGSDISVVGLLATPVTIRSGMYQDALAKRNKKVIVPTKSELHMLPGVIRNVIGGKILPKDSRKLEKIARSLQKRGAEGIVLGCTELPLVFPNSFNMPIFNSVEILAMSLLRRHYK